jgi:SAM-dependent methyltransferase
VQKGQKLAKQLGVEKQVEFSYSLADHFKSRFDMVISQNSMEHYKYPDEVLNDMKSALRQDGTILITFGPTWFAPYGSHTSFFTKIPWVNLIFDEKTVMKVRSHFRNDRASKYEEIDGGLNKMSVRKFERIISNSGMKILYRKYDCFKNIIVLGKLPLMRELFINHISFIITKDR